MIGIVHRPRWASLAALVLLLGCTSAVVRQDSDRYYGGGAEQALAALQRSPGPSQDRLLALMDEAVAEQELGRYEDSNRALAGGIELLRSSPDPLPALADGEGTYHGEYFERVYLWSLKVANDLALQDVEAAVADADGALCAISAATCARCRYPFTRYLAAISLEAAGELDGAIDVLAEAVAESPQLPFLQAELDRMLLTDDAESRGQAKSAERVLYVLLLLGKGPQKMPGVVPVPPSRVVPWPEYGPRQPPGVGGATLLVDRGDHPAVPLTDLGELARDSLAERLQAVLTKEVGATVAADVAVRASGDDQRFNLGMMFGLLPALSRCDLRHWSTLPATGQVARVVVGPQTSGFQILYTTDDGAIVDRENLELPAAWTEGPLFVTRRLP